MGCTNRILLLSFVIVGIGARLQAQQSATIQGLKCATSTAPDSAVKSAPVPVGQTVCSYCETKSPTSPVTVGSIMKSYEEAKIARKDLERLHHDCSELQRLLVICQANNCKSEVAETQNECIAKKCTSQNGSTGRVCGQFNSAAKTYFSKMYSIKINTLRLRALDHEIPIKGFCTVNGGEGKSLEWSLNNLLSSPDFEHFSGWNIENFDNHVKQDSTTYSKFYVAGSDTPVVTERISNLFLTYYQAMTPLSAPAPAPSSQTPVR